VELGIVDASATWNPPAKQPQILYFDEVLPVEGEGGSEMPANTTQTRSRRHRENEPRDSRHMGDKSSSDV